MIRTVCRAVLALSLLHVSLYAQGPQLELRSFLYADNTEFLSNPYRDGETLLGGQLRLNALFPVSPRARFLLGVETNSRAGDDKAFQKVWPVIALEVDGKPGTFIMGTLRSGQLGRDPGDGFWPEKSGPHGLTPALEVDTLSMTRPYEAGIQWLVHRERLQQDIWIAWQQLNTPSHRERLDAGLNTRATLVSKPSWRLLGLAQTHIVHEGGQLYHVGSVGDSMAGGPGVGVETDLLGGTLAVEGLGLWSKHNPSREDQGRSDRLDGRGGLGEVSYERSNWRGAYMQWHGRNFEKWEGDPNYGSVTDGGSIHHSRTYKEMSLTRRFELTKDAFMSAGLRLYRVDGSWDYSYRISAALHLTHPLARK